MRIRVLPVLVVLLLAGAFVLVNWSSVSTPTALSLGIATVTAPLGLVLLGFIVLLGVMYIASVISLQTSALLDARRLGRELQSQRELADRAEASRFTELRDFMAAELFKATQAAHQTRLDLSARLDQLEQRQRVALEQTGNGLAAHIGELEDRLQRDELHRMPPPVGDSGVRLR